MREVYSAQKSSVKCNSTCPMSLSRKRYIEFVKFVTVILAQCLYIIINTDLFLIINIDIVTLGLVIVVQGIFRPRPFSLLAKNATGGHDA